MSRQQIPRFGPERPSAPSKSSMFAPRPFAPKAPVSQPKTQDLPLQRKETAHEPERQDTPEILPVEGFSPSSTLLQFTLEDAQQWVITNKARTGYPNNWAPAPTQQEINDYIAKEEAGWEALRAALLRGGDEVVEEIEPEVAVGTVRQMFLAAMTGLAIEDPLQKAIIADLKLEDYDAESMGWLLLSDVKGIASCFETSKTLLNLVGDPESDPKNTWGQKALLSEAIPNLIEDIAAHGKSACIYRCGIDDNTHSFTIIVQNGRAELVQGFAGPSGYSLAQNLESEKQGFTFEELNALLLGLLESKTTRVAQQALFSSYVDIEKVPKKDGVKLAKSRENPSLAELPEEMQTDPGYIIFHLVLGNRILQFERRGLYSQEVIQKRITGKVTENAKRLQTAKKPVL